MYGRLPGRRPGEAGNAHAQRPNARQPRTVSPAPRVWRHPLIRPAQELSDDRLGPAPALRDSVMCLLPRTQSGSGVVSEADTPKASNVGMRKPKRLGLTGFLWIRAVDSIRWIGFSVAIFAMSPRAASDIGGRPDRLFHHQRSLPDKLAEIWHAQGTPASNLSTTPRLRSSIPGGPPSPSPWERGRSSRSPWPSRPRPRLPPPS